MSQSAGEATQFGQTSRTAKLVLAARRFGTFLVTLAVTFLGLTAITDMAIAVTI
mgnify:CR=1 FL=1